MLTTPSPVIAQLGKVVQIAFIPRDFEAGLRYWTTSMGAGPFYDLPHIPLDNTRYRGTPQECDISAALGYWGDVQIELVQQHDGAPSIYREWKESGRHGVHHIGVVVDDFDAAFASLQQTGATAAQETEIPGAVRAAYFEMPDQDVPLVEILELRPEFQRLWALMRATAAQWDGHTDPFRPVSSLEQS